MIPHVRICANLILTAVNATVEAGWGAPRRWYRMIRRWPHAAFWGGPKGKAAPCLHSYGDSGTFTRASEAAYVGPFGDWLNHPAWPEADVRRTFPSADVSGLVQRARALEVRTDYLLKLSMCKRCQGTGSVMNRRGDFGECPKCYGDPVRR